MAFYEKDAMRKTMRVKFQGPRRINTRDKVLDEINDLVDIRKLTAIYKCGEGAEWYLSFEDESECEVGDGDTRSGKMGMKVRFERIDRRAVKFRLHWYPLHMSLDLVRQFFGRYGTKVHLWYEDQVYGTDLRLKTGVIAGAMICGEREYLELPYRTVLYNRPVLLTVLGRQAQCLKCGGLGHQRATCPSQKTQQHPVQPRSYAGVVAATPEAPQPTASDTLVDGQQKEVADNGLSQGQRDGADVTPVTQDTRVTQGSLDSQSLEPDISASEVGGNEQEEMDMSGEGRKRQRSASGEDSGEKEEESGKKKNKDKDKGHDPD
ncbi:uncharacterized protein [Mytilus edulis]|uniref:uncharacterized protein n=1 Tax=Mytilus edulis TaxID=6550 RepID=UPI0039EE476C